MFVFKLLLGALGLYCVFVLAAYLLQDKLIFPGPIASTSGALSPQREHIELTASDGKTIVLSGKIPDNDTSAKDDAGKPLILGFGGNAWAGQAVLELLNQTFPANEVWVMHYRGYGVSSGKPTASALYSDAVLAFDTLADRSSKPIVAAGFSLGAAIAANLSTKRQLHGVLLVTPFDSLSKTARNALPFVPVDLLLKHRMEPAIDLAGSKTPVAVITAENDTVIPTERSAALRAAAGNLVYEASIGNTGHNDLYLRPEFTDRAREALDALDP